MWDPVAILPECTCIMGALVVGGILAGKEYYRFWKSELRGIPLSTTFQKVRVIYWWLAVVAVSAYSIFVLWLFSYWIQFFMELFKG
jgi:hypothetical protein